MYVSDVNFKTIKEAQIDVLNLILSEGEEIEETLEVNNISVCIDNPELCNEDLSESVTPIATKHMSQMMLEPNPKLDKTHYARLHNWKDKKYQSECIKDFMKLKPIANLIVTMEYDQVEEVIKRLKQNPLTKRAVLTLWQPQDVNDEYSFSFIMSQLLIRDNKLIMTSYLRSNDIYNAFPWNVQGIAKLQAKIAERLNIIPGEFIIHIGSAHIYKVHKDKIEQYLAYL